MTDNIMTQVSESKLWGDEAFVPPFLPNLRDRTGDRHVTRVTVWIPSAQTAARMRTPLPRESRRRVCDTVGRAHLFVPKEEN